MEEGQEVKGKTPEIFMDELITQRAEFYRKLKELLPKGALGFYPAPGLDPVPVDIFGKSVVYLSHPSDGTEHFATLKGSEKMSFGIYDRYFNEHGPFPEMQAVLGDVLHSDFKDNSFDFILLRNTPDFLLEDELFASEIDRLLKEGGIIAVDAEDDDIGNPEKSPHDAVLKKLIERGYKVHEMDGWGETPKVYLPGNDGEAKYPYGTHQFRVLVKQ